MAGSLDDAEFWLPRQFLTDEDFLLDGKAFAPRTTVSGDDVARGGLGYGPGSGLSSPVDSLLGSLEGESDEEDLIPDLTRKMALSTLDESFNTFDESFNTFESKVRFPSGSPQSTLCPGWDAAALCEAAAEVARLRLTEQLYGLSRSRASGEAMYGAGARRSPAPGPVKTHSSDGVFSHHSHSLTYHQLVANQIQLLKQQQAILKQQQRAGANWGMSTKPASGPYNAAQTCRRKVESPARPLTALSPAAWPSLQQQQQQRRRTGTRAVFLGAPPSSKRECAGTGVFLPRRAGTQPEPRKKPAACATVLLPDKVVRALNLNLENVGPQPHLTHCANGSLAPDNGCVWNLRRTGVAAQQQQQQQLWGGRPQPAATHHEIRLPQEWTY